MVIFYIDLFSLFWYRKSDDNYYILDVIKYVFIADLIKMVIRRYEKIEIIQELCTDNLYTCY